MKVTEGIEFTKKCYCVLITFGSNIQDTQIRPEDKVVQLILEKATIARLQEVDTLDNTERSPGGTCSLKEQSMA